MTQESGETPAFACCSSGIGRWFWVVWDSESDARAQSPAVACGYESSATRAEAKAMERLGPGARRLAGKWASGYRRGGRPAAPAPRTAGTPGQDESSRPKSRIGGLRDASRQDGKTARLDFLHCVTEREPPDALGHFAVARHRIVKQNPRKIHVDSDPFDEDEWARRQEVEAGDSTSSGEVARTRTLAVDRVLLRTEGRFRCRHAGRELVFYASEDDGIRDVEAALTEKHTWCATLGVRFPCSPESIKAAYRRLAMVSHPDAGGDPAQFQTVEQAYREALAYFSQADDAGA